MLKLQHYNTRHFIDFSPEKSDFFSKFACISSTILTFLPNNPSCLYTKNSQKVNFSSNCAYNTGHFIDFSPKKSDFFLKMRLHIEHYFDLCFYTKNSQKVHFSSNCAYNTVISSKMKYIFAKKRGGVNFLSKLAKKMAKNVQ